MKREFKDLVTFEPYEYLNSEITGNYDKAHAVKCDNGEAMQLGVETTKGSITAGMDADSPMFCNACSKQNTKDSCNIS